MRFSLGFAKKTVEFSIGDRNIRQVLLPNETVAGLTGIEEVRRAMREPIGTPRLRDIVKKGEKIAIVTSDITRPMPSKTVLPVVLEELAQAGIADSDICVVFALGSHRRHKPEEKAYLVGEEVMRRIRCVDSSEGDFIHLGTTRLGTPVDIARPVAQADRVVCLGNIEFHYFAGYSGGAKAIMPGVSTRSAIQANHSRMVEELARAGNLDTNPVRQDIEDAARLQKIDFLLNVVLDDKKRIVKAVAGHPVLAHRAGCQFLDALYMVKIRRKADIVVATPGGYPKDINLYQAQKALDNAKHAVRDGGVIILLASCAEGLGEGVFEEWLTTAKGPHDLVERIQTEFKLGGHKAAAIAMVLEKARVFLVSNMEPDFVRGIFLEPYADMESALKEAFAAMGEDAQVIVMPVAGSTLPKLAEE